MASRSALTPTIYAATLQQRLVANKLMLPLVNYNYNADIADRGDIVMVPRIGDMSAGRQPRGSSATKVTAAESQVRVALDQMAVVYTEIEGRDTTVMDPAIVQGKMTAMADGLHRFVERSLLAQRANFFGNTVGTVGGGIDKALLTEVDRKMTELYVPETGRNLITGAYGYQDIQNIPELMTAYNVADGGQAMRTGRMGERFGFNILRSPLVTHQTDTDTNTAAVSGNHAAGSTTISLAAGGGLLCPVGSYILIAGDMVPHLVTAVATDDITIATPLVSAVVDTAVVTATKPFTAGADYAAGYEGVLTIADGGSDGLVPDRLFSIGSEYFGANELQTGVVTTSLVPSQPPVSAIASGATISPLPAADYNFAFDKGAITVVSRPMNVLTPRGMKSPGKSITFGAAGLYITLDIGEYNVVTDSTPVVARCLFGVKTVDANRGVLVLS